MLPMLHRSGTCKGEFSAYLERSVENAISLENSIRCHVTSFVYDATPICIRYIMDYISLLLLHFALEWLDLN